MKTMKRFLAAAMAVTSVMAIAPMSAFAENETGGSTNVTFDAPRNSPDFTITIPASVDLNNSRKATIKAENVYLDTSKHKQINVTLDSAQYVETGASTFIAKTADGNSSVTYTIGKDTATTGVKVGDTVAEFTADSSVTLNFSAPTGATYAGTHTETLTFGIAVENAAPANPYAANSVGDVVTFGSYNWYVIGKSDDGVTLLMKDNLMTKAYNDSYTNITWENCSLRNYLNNDFYNGNGFSNEDRAKIVSTHNSNPNNSEYNTSGGNDTDDYIYLLSIAEANALDDINRSIRANGYWCWLRSPGIDSDYAAFVGEGGNVASIGHSVAHVGGVRPALNLKF